LYFFQGTSDKEYHLQHVESGNLYLVNFQFGRRGSTLQSGSKTPSPLTYDKAKKLYDKILNEKTAKGYEVSFSGSTGVYVPSKPAKSTPGTSEIGARRKIVWEGPEQETLIPQLLNEIKEGDLEAILRDDSFGAQEKKDGRHQMIRKSGGVVTMTNRKGKEISYPEVYANALPDMDIILDGEAIGEVFYAFDILEIDGENLRDHKYSDRFSSLERVQFGDAIHIVPMVVGYEDKKALYDKLLKEDKEGIVFKKLSAPYKPGRPNTGGDMLKKKFYATLSARVKKGRSGKRSVGLELLDGTVWVGVGNVTIPQNKDIPAIGSVVEIRYLYGYKGGSLYQPIYLDPRDDIDESECKLGQVKYSPQKGIL